MLIYCTFRRRVSSPSPLNFYSPCARVVGWPEQTFESRSPTHDCLSYHHYLGYFAYSPRTWLLDHCRLTTWHPWIWSCIATWVNHYGRDILRVVKYIVPLLLCTSVHLTCWNFWVLGASSSSLSKLGLNTYPTRLNKLSRVVRRKTIIWNFLPIHQFYTILVKYISVLSRFLKYQEEVWCRY